MPGDRLGYFVPEVRMRICWIRPPGLGAFEALFSSSARRQWFRCGLCPSSAVSPNQLSILPGVIHRCISPPNRDVVLLNGALQAPVAPLCPRSGQRLPTPDPEQHEFPICMVPSGTGTTAGRQDGTIGASATMSGMAWSWP